MTASLNVSFTNVDVSRDSSIRAAPPVALVMLLLFVAVITTAKKRRKQRLSRLSDSRSPAPLEEGNPRTSAQEEEADSHNPPSPPPEVIDSHTPLPPEANLRTSVLLEDALRSLSSIHATPTLHAIDITRRLVLGEFRDRGGFADVYEGLLSASTDDDTTHDLGPTKVAVKVVRVFVSGQNVDALRRKVSCKIPSTHL